MALRRSLHENLRRHEAWRTGFSVVGDDLLQVVPPGPAIQIPFLPVEQREAEAARLATDDMAQPILLDEPPLLRARVVRVSATDHRLLLTLHHIIFDGVSIYRIFVPELASLYTAFAAGKPSPLADLPLQYGDYAVWRQ